MLHEKHFPLLMDKLWKTPSRHLKYHRNIPRGDIVHESSRIQTSPNQQAPISAHYNADTR